MGGDNVLEHLGQNPAIQIFTQITLCYPVPDSSVQQGIADTLAKGLEKLTSGFPWVSGQVINEGANAMEGSTGIYKVVPLGKTPRLIVKDLRDDASIMTMEQLRSARFPFKLLDEGIVSPKNTIPGTSGEIVTDFPIFLVQANFIQGGLLLTFVGLHSAMDLTGQAQLMHLLSKACRGEEYTAEELSSGNLDRTSIVPLLDDSFDPSVELKNQLLKPTPSTSAPASTESPPPTNPSWAYFAFDSSSLASLKSIATQTLPASAKYITTDDALTSFVWKSILRARLPRLDPASEVKFARAVDVRRYFNVPETYPGFLQNMTFHSRTLQELMDSSIGSIAAELRSAVDPKTTNLVHATRALATVMHRAKDNSNINMTASINLSSDIMLSSWAKVACYDMDFGLGLGKPEAVRRPQFVPVESLIYLMPKKADGEILVGMCLREEDLARLKSDEEFSKYASFIG